MFTIADRSSLVIGLVTIFISTSPCRYPSLPILSVLDNNSLFFYDYVTTYESLPKVSFLFNSAAILAWKLVARRESNSIQESIVAASRWHIIRSVGKFCLLIICYANLVKFWPLLRYKTFSLIPRDPFCWSLRSFQKRYFHLYRCTSLSFFIKTYPWYESDRVWSSDCLISGEPRPCLARSKASDLQIEIWRKFELIETVRDVAIEPNWHESFSVGMLNLQTNDIWSC